MSTGQLSPLDCAFLQLEQADPSAHMHIGAVLVFDPLPNRRAPTHAELAQRFEERAAALPHYGDRLSHPMVGALSRPTWERDPTFGFSTHVRRAALPEPG